MTDSAIAAILHNRNQGQRDSSYAMLMQLVATNQMPECLCALEQMALKCWRDVRGFIRHFEQNGVTSAAEFNASAHSLIQGCVRMTNAQLRKDCANANNASMAAKWVPREPKCRGSPLLQWYYDALAADLFPGAPDAKRRYRKLVSALSPPTTTTPMNPTLAWFVKQAERVMNPAERVMDPAERVMDPTSAAQEINALWKQHVARHKPAFPAAAAPGPLLLPVLSLAHSMGPGHNNCLHEGIGLALHVLHVSSLSSTSYRILTFSSHAEWHTLENDFVSQAQHLLRAARSPLNGLNANLGAALSASSTPRETLLIIGDMEHDEPTPSQVPVSWNVSRNGRPATIYGDNPTLLRQMQII